MLGRRKIARQVLLCFSPNFDILGSSMKLFADFFIYKDAHSRWLNWSKKKLFVSQNELLICEFSIRGPK